MADIAIFVLLTLIFITLVDICIHVRQLVKIESTGDDGVRAYGHRVMQGDKGYAVWMYKQGAWQLDSDRCGEAFVPGGPPQRPGNYEGEVVKKAGVPV